MVPLSLSVSINVLWLENLKRQFVLPNGFPRPHQAVIERITTILRRMPSALAGSLVFASACFLGLKQNSFSFYTTNTKTMGLRR